MKHAEDVAFLELAPEHAGALEKEFVDAARLQVGISGLPDDNVLVYGYPSEKVDRALFDEKKLRVQPVGFLTPTMPLDSIKNFAGTLRPEYDLVFEYPKKGNYLVTGEAVPKMPEAPGISGGGVWATCVREDGVWAPDKCRLIAIERSWVKFEWARCTQIQHWLDLLRCEIPELKADVDRLLPARP